MIISGFLNTVNVCAIAAMALYHIAKTIFFNKQVRLDGSVYIYIALIASMLNIMHSINLSDAVFWYGANLESGVRGSVFIVISSSVFFIFSKILDRRNNSEVDTFNQLRNAICSIDNLREKYLDLKSEIASTTDAIVRIHSISEDVKKNELMIKEMAADMQKISDSMATLAEEFLKIKSK